MEVAALVQSMDGVTGGVVSDAADDLSVIDAAAGSRRDQDDSADGGAETKACLERWEKHIVRNFLPIRFPMNQRCRASTTHAGYAV